MRAPCKFGGDPQPSTPSRPFPGPRANWATNETIGRKGGDETWGLFGRYLHLEIHPLVVAPLSEMEISVGSVYEHMHVPLDACFFQANSGESG